MRNLTIILSISMLFSCSVKDYYQVYKTSPEDINSGKKSTVTKNGIIFNEKNCTISYNFWDEGGDIGFTIFNKTESDLTIDLTKSYFVLNDWAQEYFQNRTFSKSSSSGTVMTTYRYPYYWNVNKVAGTSSNSFSTAYVEKPRITIPAKTNINISEYHITNQLLTSCDLPKYPSRKNVKSLKYEKTNSPFVFYNIITCICKGDTERMENKFYVSEITNYPLPEIVKTIYKNDCGQTLVVSQKIFKDITPDKFFIHYILDKN